MTTKAEWVTGSRFMNHALPALAGFLAACGSVSAEQTRPDSGNVGPDAHERGDVLTTLDGRRPSPDGEGKADGQRKADGRSGPDGPGSADGTGSDAGCSSG